MNRNNILNHDFTQVGIHQQAQKSFGYVLVIYFSLLMEPLQEHELTRVEAFETDESKRLDLDRVNIEPETFVRPFKDPVCISEEIWPQNAEGMTESTKLEVVKNVLVQVVTRTYKMRDGTEKIVTYKEDLY